MVEQYPTLKRAILQTPHAHCHPFPRRQVNPSSWEIAIAGPILVIFRREGFGALLWIVMELYPQVFKASRSNRMTNCLPTRLRSHEELISLS
jgi:hypothetical protein